MKAICKDRVDSADISSYGQEVDEDYSDSDTDDGYSDCDDSLDKYSSEISDAEVKFHIENDDKPVLTVCEEKSDSGLSYNLRPRRQRSSWFIRPEYQLESEQDFTAKFPVKSPSKTPVKQKKDKLPSPVPKLDVFSSGEDE